MKFTKTLLLMTFAAFTGSLNAGVFGGGGGTPPLVIIEEASGGWSNVSHIFTDTKVVVDSETGLETEVPVFPRVEIVPEDMTRLLGEFSKKAPISKVMVGERVAYFHADIVDVPNRRLHGKLYYQHVFTAEEGLHHGESVDAPITVNLFDLQSVAPVASDVELDSN